MKESRPYILLVEDNPDDELLTRRALRKNRVPNEIVVIRDGAAAIDFLMAQGEYAGRTKQQPDLILLDLKMPKVDGLELLKTIRADKRTAMLPVVVLTTSNEQSDIRRSYAYGANSYVRKPVDFDQFTDSMRLIGEYWLALNELPSDGEM